MVGTIFPNIVVLVAVAGMAIYGWQQGLFLATIAGLQIAASLLAGLALLPEVAAFVVSWGIPAEQAAAVAFVMLFALGILTVRLAVGAGVPRDAVSFAPVVDTVGGGVVGAAAGFVLAGGMLIAWSMGHMPDGVRLDTSGVLIDPGAQMLATFTRCVQPAGPAREILCNGEASSAGASAPQPGGSPRCSEPFVDANHNGLFDNAERYLDLDRNGGFTRQRPFVDTNGNGRRDFGLRECYRLASWRDLAVLHSPRITSPAVAERKREGDFDTELYQAVASDDDPDDTLKFAIKADVGDDAADLVIDPAGGRVSLLDPPAVTARKTYRFTVVVTDRHGLEAEQPVSVTIGPGRR